MTNDRDELGIFDELFGKNTPRRENGHGGTTGRKRPRGYADWRPQRKTHLLLEQVATVLQEYEAQLPLTVRQIFYRLVGAFGFEKTEQAYGRLCQHLVRARRARLVPFGSIRDDGVATISSAFYGSPEDFWDETGRRIRAYRRDRQDGQYTYLELWCEAAGMAPQLATVADRYSVPVYSAGGFASLTAVRQIAERAVKRNVPTTILHVGDFDPSGESIFESMVEDAQAFVRVDRVTMIEDVQGVRLALTADQVAEHELPTAPPKRSDSRSARWGDQTCQLEALPPDVLAGEVEAAIESRLDVNLLEQQIKQEDADRLALYRGLPSGEAPAG